MQQQLIPPGNQGRGASLDGQRVCALLFDVDGTLYSQSPVRLCMSLRLMFHVAMNPARGLRDLRLLRAYRHSQEEIRQMAGGRPADQLRLSCERTGHDADDAAACIGRWMESEPLPLLRRFSRPGLHSFLATAAARGLALGVVSDYPAAEKLKAIGVAGYFRTVVCAQDDAAACFKPSPDGLLAAARLLGVNPSDAIYIGDRPEVDGEAAKRAGMRAIIIGRGDANGPFRTARDYAALGKELFGASY